MSACLQVTVKAYTLVQSMLLYYTRSLIKMSMKCKQMLSQKKSLSSHLIYTLTSAVPFIKVLDYFL